jgi:hypothetical protein
MPMSVAAIPPVKRRVGPVVGLILRDLWELKLGREGLGTSDDDPNHKFGLDGRHPLRFRSLLIAERAEYFRTLEREKRKFRDPKDRKIAFALANGIGILRISREQHVGQYRIGMVLSEMVKGRKTPWHWRKRSSGKVKAVPRSRLHRQRLKRQREALTRH